MVTPVILTLVLAGQATALWAMPWFALQASMPKAAPRSPHTPS